MSSVTRLPHLRDFWVHSTAVELLIDISGTEK